MGANIQQPAINLREEVAKQSIHHHDEEYVKLSNNFGKNLLINGDLSVSQPADYSGGTPIVNNGDKIDGFYTVLSGVTGTFIHDTTTKVARLEATSTASGYFGLIQAVEDSPRFAGRTVTLTAEVRGNCEARLRVFYKNGAAANIILQGEAITPNEEWQTISYTLSIGDSVLATAGKTSSLQFQVMLYDNAAVSVTSGDYFEVRNMQAEEGDKFTGFELVDPALNLSNCQRRYWKGELMGRGLGNHYVPSAQTSMFAGGVSFPVTMRVSPTLAIETAPTYITCTSAGLNGNEDGFIHRVDTAGATKFRAEYGVYSADARI